MKVKYKRIPTALSVFLTLSSYYVFQGVRAMSAYEISLRVFIWLCTFLVLNALISDQIVSIFVTHTGMLVLNGQFWVLARFFGVRPLTNARLSDVLDVLYSLEKFHSVEVVSISGSLSRGKLHTGSDIDVKVLSRSGALDNGYVAIIVAIVRFMSFFKVWPVDIYHVSHRRDLYKIADNEVALNIYDIRCRDQKDNIKARLYDLKVR